MAELVAEPCIEEIDRLAHHVAGDLGPHDLAVDVDRHLGNGGPVPSRIRRLGQLHACEQDGLVDVLDDCADPSVRVGLGVVSDVAAGDDQQGGLTGFWIERLDGFIAHHDHLSISSRSLNRCERQPAAAAARPPESADPRRPRSRSSQRPRPQGRRRATTRSRRSSLGSCSAIRENGNTTVTRVPLTTVAGAFRFSLPCESSMSSPPTRS